MRKVRGSVCLVVGCFFTLDISNLIIITLNSQTLDILLYSAIYLLVVKATKEAKRTTRKGAATESIE